MKKGNEHIKEIKKTFGVFWGILLGVGLVLILFLAILFLFLPGGALLSVPVSLFAFIIGIVISFKGFRNSIRVRKYFKAVVAYVFLMSFTALFFSYLFVVFAGVPGNSLNFREGEMINLGGFSNFYYNAVTLTTLGYGDIYPRGSLFMFISVLEVLIGLSINLIFITTVIREVRRK